MRYLFLNVNTDCRFISLLTTIVTYLKLLMFLSQKLSWFRKYFSYFYHIFAHFYRCYYWITTKILLWLSLWNIKPTQTDWNKTKWNCETRTSSVLASFDGIPNCFNPNIVFDKNLLLNDLLVSSFLSITTSFFTVFQW